VFTVGYVHTQPAASQLASADSLAALSASATPDNSISLQTAASSTEKAVPTPTIALSPSFILPPLTARRSDGGEGDGGGDGGTPRLFRPIATPTPLPAVSSQTTTTGTALAARYRDGSYTGMAENRHGYVQATVVIAGGRIASAAISDCGMQYPCSRIAMLPGEVLTRQNTDTDLVSGATMSSTAYQGAVAQALSKAAV
ncbi:MAG TPA: FMN-binding protein, partial [Chloroflexota bacterium]